MRATLAIVLAWSVTAFARDAHVTAITPTTIYIDAGSADGLAAGASWQARVDGRLLRVRVAAVASHDAELEVDGPRPAVGAVLALPPGLTPPAPIAPRPPPATLPPWREDPSALASVQIIASAEQPAEQVPDQTIVSGELALSFFLAADAGRTSTSWQELSLASQLAIESGAWRYDHLLDAHIVATPELFFAPLQHAKARFDVYLMRLEYAPGRYAASLGRQPGAPLGELGSVDGGRFRLALAREVDVTAFAGLRPASDLTLSLVPRIGADLGWHRASDGMRVRADAGIAVDEYKARLDRALAAGSASIATRLELLHTDAAVDLGSDAAGGGARLTRASGLARAKRGSITTSVSAGYDRPFLDRALVAELPGLVLGPRTFAGVDVIYAWRHGLDFGSSARASRGDGFASAYLDVLASWYDAGCSCRANVAPHVVVGSLVDQAGVRLDLGRPLLSWYFDAGGSFDRVYAAGESAWAGLARISASRGFLRRWRTSLSFEGAAGDGPPRLFVFALLGYRLGT